MVDKCKLVVGDTLKISPTINHFGTPPFSYLWRICFENKNYFKPKE